MCIMYGTYIYTIIHKVYINNKKSEKFCTKPLSWEYGKRKDTGEYSLYCYIFSLFFFHMYSSD